MKLSRFQSAALMALQEAAEAYLTTLFEVRIEVVVVELMYQYYFPRTLCCVPCTPRG